MGNPYPAVSRRRGRVQGVSWYRQTMAALAAQTRHGVSRIRRLVGDAASVESLRHDRGFIGICARSRNNDISVRKRRLAQNRGYLAVSQTMTVRLFYHGGC